MNRGRALLLAQRKGPKLDPPPHLTAEQLEAWRDIVGACHDVLRRRDAVIVETAAIVLTRWREGQQSTAWLRLLYRMLGKLLLPMPARRRLLFDGRA
jgi:hypothetical protein